MAVGLSEGRCLLDEFLPNYDFGATYEIEIYAPPAVVYRHVLLSDFYAAWVVRLLMSLRTGKRIRRNQPLGDLLRQCEGTGFFILADVPDEEMVIGVAGKFWRPDGGRCLDLRPGDFVRFARPGYARAVMNFRVRPEPLCGGAVLSTETRIQCCDREARRKFRLYWALIESFSGVIRKAILKQVKERAEADVQRLRRERIA